MKQVIQKIEARIVELKAEMGVLEVEQKAALKNSDWQKSKDIDSMLMELHGRIAGLNEAGMMVIYS